MSTIKQTNVQQELSLLEKGIYSGAVSVCGRSLEDIGEITQCEIDECVSIMVEMVEQSTVEGSDGKDFSEDEIVEIAEELFGTIMSDNDLSLKMNSDMLDAVMHVRPKKYHMEIKHDGSNYREIYGEEDDK